MIIMQDELYNLLQYQFDIIYTKNEKILDDALIIGKCVSFVTYNFFKDLKLMF